MTRPRHACAVVLGLFVLLAEARGQSAFSDPAAIRSVSGQFVVSRVADDAPYFRRLPAPAGTNVVRLDPALLAVAAERFKISLWQQLGVRSDAAWSGKIFLVVLPARVPDESVAIAASPFLNHWNYRVEFPDVLAKARYARALSAVLLLELANRSARTDGPSAEIPAWLVDGMARQVLAADGEKVVLSAPVKKPDGLPAGRLEQVEHDFDALAAARAALQSAPALTFDQLSWPTETQMEGADGGIYFASAQLFLSELLALDHGREKLRALLAELPAHLNWQTAFFIAFGDDFKRPLDVEKWWALRVVNFAARSPGPRWTTAASRERLAALLSVPVEFRNSSNALPAHADISLQAALQNLTPEQRDLVLRLKVRDLGLVELRLAPPFGELADGYRTALADFLGELKRPTTVSLVDKHAATRNRPASLATTLKRLDTLDRRLREAENRAVIPLPGNSPRRAP